jgi:hypothetical protein
MESVQSKLGYYPQCPHCEADDGFDVAMCPHTVGEGGLYELVSCRNCHKLINICYPPVSQLEE